MAAIINAVSGGAGGIQVAGDTTGQLQLQTGGTTAMTVNASQQASFVNNVNMPNTFGFKNRVINGAMMIDQRYGGTQATPTDGAYVLDRYIFSASQSSKYTVQQTPSTTETNYTGRLAAGFTNYIAITSSSAYSVGSNELFAMQQRIEGNNTADLMWGTNYAKTVTVSFWAYSSLTGNFGFALTNGTVYNSYTASYSIPVANTWTYVTITIPGPTSGTWPTNTSCGLNLFWVLGAGTSRQTAAGVWTASPSPGSTYYQSPPSPVQVVGTSGATLYITGVQLEVGTQATSFDYRDYGRELIMCQRYFEVGVNLIDCYANSSNAVFGNAPFKATKRATPTVTDQGLSYNGLTVTNFAVGISSVTYSDGFSTIHNAIVNGGAPSTGAARWLSIFTASAEL